jgi:tetraacyldisaccharide 4'-kinase
MTGFPRHWMQRGALACLLLPASALFFILIWLRRGLYALGLLAQTQLRVPVIVVGNLVAGGSGKTPVVISLVGALAAAGRKPGVISRGYGGNVDGVMRVSPDTDPAIAGDEPVLIARRTGCPVWVGASRVQAGEALLATTPECDVIVADDGLQHYALARKVEIAVFDERGAGNGWLLPAGPLRESLSRLGSIDFVLYQGAASPPVAHPRAFGFRLVGAEFYRLTDTAQVESASAFAGRQVAAIAAIGNPQRFFATLDALGVRAECHAFPDHYSYRSEDLDFAGAEAILMTEKDAVKCVAFAPANAWALRVDAELPAALLAGVLEALNGP